MKKRLSECGLDERTRDLCGIYALPEQVGFFTQTAACSKDGTVAIGKGIGIEGESGGLIVRNANDQEIFNRDFDAWILCVAFSPSGKSLVAMHSTGSFSFPATATIYRYDAATMRQEASANADLRSWHFLDDDLAIVHTTIPVDQRQLRYDHLLTLWDVNTFDQIATLRESDFDGFAVSPDRKWIAVAHDERIEVFEIKRK